MDELTIAFKIESPPSWLPIGRTAENNWRTVEIDCSYWFNMNANGEVVLMYKPSCGMSPYPLLTERDGDNIIWRPKSGELVEGVGRLQAFFEVGTDVIGSSDMVSCEVDSSLLGVDPGTDPGQTDLPWALDIIEQIAELSGHYPKIIDGDLYIWDSTLNDWVEFEAGVGGAVDSVNGKTGAVVLDASDVGALPDDTPIPAAVTEQTVAGWGFTKNTGTYSKPSGGIPKTDLAQAVQTSLGKADTALQPDALQTELDDNVGAFNHILTLSGTNTVTSVDEFLTIALSLNSARQVQFWIVLERDGEGRATLFIKVYPIIYDRNNLSLALVGEYDGNRYSTTLTAASASSTMTGTLVVEPIKELPTVTASDNGKFLRVVNGAWAAETVQTWQGGSY